MQVFLLNTRLVSQWPRWLVFWWFATAVAKIWALVYLTNHMCVELNRELIVETDPSKLQENLKKWFDAGASSLRSPSNSKTCGHPPRTPRVIFSVIFHLSLSPPPPFPSPFSLPLWPFLPLWHNIFKSEKIGSGKLQIGKFQPENFQSENLKSGKFKTKNSTQGIPNRKNLNRVGSGAGADSGSTCELTSMHRNARKRRWREQLSSRRQWPRGWNAMVPLLHRCVSFGELGDVYVSPDAGWASASKARWG